MGGRVPANLNQTMRIKGIRTARWYPPMSWMTRRLPLSLYVHIPWCVRKCPYCDFNSHTACRRRSAGLCRSAALDLDKEWRPRPVGRSSACFWRWNPESAACRCARSIIDGLSPQAATVDDVEVTLEANPGTAEAARFAAYRAAGVNRLFDRRAEPDDAALAQSVASIPPLRRSPPIGWRVAGSGNINLDLMFGLPQQTIGGALDELRAVIASNLSTCPGTS